MYEDRTIEEKYLYNFSQKERELFYQEQRRKSENLVRYQGKLNELMFSESQAVFANDEPKSSSLEIKYVLNRIAANDPRDTAFELGSTDHIKNADQLAFSIAQAFRNNTCCKRLVLNHIGLTDEGLLPILEALKDHKLDLLDIGGSKATDKSWSKLNEVLSNPQNKWGKVYLGRIKITPELANSFSKKSNLSFNYVACLPKRSNGFFPCFFRQKS